MTVIDEIAVERRRQVEVEGWTAQHDDTHSCGEMTRAAALYAMPESWREMIGGYSIKTGDPGVKRYIHRQPRNWPWEPSSWKPTTRRRDLIKAAALIVAEIERLDRAQEERGS